MTAGTDQSVWQAKSSGDSPALVPYKITVVDLKGLFPRMARWRSDKKAQEADTIETVKALLEGNGP